MWGQDGKICIQLVTYAMLWYFMLLHGLGNSVILIGCLCMPSYCSQADDVNSCHNTRLSIPQYPPPPPQFYFWGDFILSKFKILLLRLLSTAKTKMKVGIDFWGSDNLCVIVHAGKMQAII